MIKAVVAVISKAVPTLAATYLLTSWILHYYPSLLHPTVKQRRSRWKKEEEGKVVKDSNGNGGTKKQRLKEGEEEEDPRFTSLYIAHRGCRMEGIPENTLAAFKHALDASAQIVEFDVWLTADNKVVVFHDEDLQRMTGVKGSIEKCKYSELPAILISEGEHAGVNDGNRRMATRIPLLQEVLELVPAGVPLIIEFKQKSEVLIREVHGLVASRKDVVIWFSLREDINVDLRRWDPEIPNIASVASMLKVIGLYYFQLLPFWPLEEDMLGVPIDKVDYARVRGSSALKSLPDFICYGLAQVLGGKPPKALIPSGLFDHLRRRGMPVFFLGVNDEEDIEVACKAGATAVLTDRPRWLNERIRGGSVRLKKLS